MSRELTASTFKAAVIDAGHPVLVSFYADGCGPCRMQAPMLETLEARFRGTATIFKVNAEHSPELASLFGVRSVPTMLLFAGGKIAGRFAGLTNSHDLITAMLASLDDC
ncbi:thioredoxin [Novosphingobium sediminis]|uniref:Thioredoxin n=1 Tax=Novosphingobium sediminis TaxID=707214 RepID=A0A512ARK1_9SPHN|nr:thioredoxin family protein [Novosphingobium sediminis]GEO02316.1 thioredoxin [Novosphingobium sediminis]